MATTESPALRVGQTRAARVGQTRDRLTLHVRFDNETAEKIKAEARRAGMPSSTYIRMQVLKALEA